MHQLRNVCIVSVSMLALGFAAGCGTSRPARTAVLDPELRQNAEAARAAMAANNPRGAAQLYAAALVRARVIDDGPEIAHAAYNLAICLATSDRCEEALVRLSEARHQAGKDQEGLIDLTEAKLLLRLGRIEDARRMLAAAEALLDPDAKIGITAQSQLLSASLALASGDAPGARGALALAEVSVRAAGDDKLKAELHEITGRVLLKESRQDEAAREFEQASDLYRVCGLHADMALLLAEAAAASAAAGQNEKAADLFFRAGRSHQGAGNKAAADELFARAIAAAGLQGAPVIRRRIDELAR